MELKSGAGLMECNWVHWIWGETIFLSNYSARGALQYRWENILHGVWGV